MIDYPDYLPLPERDGYEFQHVSPMLRSEMVTGRARQRRRYTSVPSMAQVAWLFETSGQAALFELWFKESLTDGADWFNMPLQTPEGFEESYQCRFADIYTGPILVGNDSWRFTATLELFKRPILQKEWLDYPDALINANIIDMAVNQEWPE